MQKTLSLKDLLDRIFAEVQAASDSRIDPLGRLIEKGVVIRDAAGHWLMAEPRPKVTPAE